MEERKIINHKDLNNKILKTQKCTLKKNNLNNKSIISTTSKVSDVASKFDLKKKKFKLNPKSNLSLKKKNIILKQIYNDNTNSKSCFKTLSQIKTPKEDFCLYGNLIFNDGSKFDPNLNKVIHFKKKKGPSNNDLNAHLLKLQKQKQKFKDLTSEDQKKHQINQIWKTAFANALSIKLKNNEALLNKSIIKKRKQKLKKKIKWEERVKTLDDDLKLKKKKRFENIANRKKKKFKK